MTDGIDVLIAAAGEHGDAFQAAMAAAPKPAPTDGDVKTENAAEGRPAVVPVAEAKEAEQPEPKSKPDEELDAIDRFIKGATDPEPKSEWTDEAKALFKSIYGSDDPHDFLIKHNTLKEELAQATSRAAQADEVMKRFNNMPFELAQAIKAVQEGKPYKQMLEDLATGATLSKAAKDIDKESLVNRYFPKHKFTSEQLEAIKDGTADEVTKDAWDKFVDLASQKHDSERGSRIEAEKAIAEQRKQVLESYKKADLEAVSFAKSNKGLAALIDDNTVQKFLSGELEDELLYNPDGSRKRESFALLVQGQKFPEIFDRIMKGAEARGANKAELKQHGKLPQSPSAESRREAAPQNKDATAKAITDGQSLIASLMAV